MVHSLDLPEITDQIASFLSKKTLFQCLLVSHAWHRAFLPNLWKDVLLQEGDSEQPQILDSLMQHAHFVQELSIDGDGTLSECRVLALNFPRLQKFCPRIHFTCTDEMVDAIKDLVRRQGPLLKTIFLSSDQQWLSETPDRSPWNTIITGCKGHRQLRSLSMFHVAISVEDLDHGAKDLLKELDTLALHFTVLYRSTFDSTLPVWEISGSKVRDLTLVACEHEFPSDHNLTEYRLLLDCQEIRSLTWERYLRDEMVPMAKDLQRGCWPFLENLDFRSLDIRDGDLSEILWSMGRPLRALNANGTGFGPLCSHALLNQLEGEGTNGVDRGSKRHAVGLRYLILQACPAVTGSHIQAFLCSFPKLEQLSARLLKEEDVLADPRPWICTEIKKLELHFALVALDWHTGNYPSEAIAKATRARARTTVFWDRLKELTRLEEFSSGNHLCATRDKNNLIKGGDEQLFPSLQFRLEDDGINSHPGEGLDRLQSWRGLRTLRLMEPAQRVSLLDAEWMVKHWPVLNEVLTYRWHVDDMDHTLIKTFLNAHGVTFY